MNKSCDIKCSSTLHTPSPPLTVQSLFFFPGWKLKKRCLVVEYRFPIVGLTAADSPTTRANYFTTRETKKRQTWLAKKTHLAKAESSLDSKVRGFISIWRGRLTKCLVIGLDKDSLVLQ